MTSSRLQFTFMLLLVFTAAFLGLAPNLLVRGFMAMMMVQGEALVNDPGLLATITGELRAENRTYWWIALACGVAAVVCGVWLRRRREPLFPPGSKALMFYAIAFICAAASNIHPEMALKKTLELMGTIKAGADMRETAYAAADLMMKAKYNLMLQYIAVLVLSVISLLSVWRKTKPGVNTEPKPPLNDDEKPRSQYDY